MLTTTRKPPFEVGRLVERAADGDHDAWNELVDEFADLVWAIARSHRLSDEDAADVSQTTWCKLVEHLDRLKEPGRVGAWLVTTARRESIACKPRAARMVPWGDDPPELADIAPQHDARLLREERDEALWTAFTRLDERDRTLLRMTVAEPSPCYKEVGAVLGMPVGSIGPTRGRALERLRRAVGDDLDLLRMEAA